MKKTHDRSIQALFTSADRKRLKRALSTVREARVYRRMDALLLLAEGHSISEAAKRARCERTTLRRWAVRYLRDHDVGGVADRPRHGRPRTAQQLDAQRLGAVLARDPRQYGYRAASWTVPLLAAHLRTHEQLSISERTLRRRLHEENFRWKRPRYIYSERAEHVGQKKGGSSGASGQA